jgi:hypothetical protein
MEAAKTSKEINKSKCHATPQASMVARAAGGSSEIRAKKVLTGLEVSLEGVYR